MQRFWPYVGIAVAVAIGVAAAPLIGPLFALALICGVIWMALPYWWVAAVVVGSAGFCYGVYGLIVDLHNRRHGTLMGLSQWIVLIVGFVFIKAVISNFVAPRTGRTTASTAETNEH